MLQLCGGLGTSGYDFQTIGRKSQTIVGAGGTDTPIYMGVDTRLSVLPQAVYSFDALQRAVARLVPGSVLTSENFVDPEDGWEKQVFRVDTEHLSIEKTFELEEALFAAAAQDSALAADPGKAVVIFS